MATLYPPTVARQPDVESGAFRGRPNRQGAVEGPDTFLQRHRSESQGGERGIVVLSLEREAAAVVGHDDVHGTVRCADGEVHLRGPGMSRGIDHRLLDDEADL